MRAWLLGFLLYVCYAGHVYSVIHEAYLPAITDCLPLKAINKKPPKDKKEKISNQPNEACQWILGYWHWDSKKEDFEWVNGIWRRPPPGHYWIPGYWHKHKHQWTYVKGFWSPRVIQELVYLPLPPSEIKDEHCECPGENYWWNPGYWSYDSSLQNYEWVNGKWSPYQEDGIQVPTHYRWYQKGYVCIPSFWDWPFEKRGDNCSCHDLAKQLLPCYPDYLYFYQYYTYTYPNFLDTCEWAPQWWECQDWWSYSWNDHWNAWWCYTHPNYFEPDWFGSSLYSINRPCDALIACMQNGESPLFIGEQSPYSYDHLFSACEWTNGCLYPPIYWGADPVFVGKDNLYKNKTHQASHSIQGENTCRNENFALQWHYFCNRFYYRRLGLWFNVCHSYSCSTCQVDEEYRVNQRGYARNVISNIVLEQESQRVERFRFLSLLALYGPHNRCHNGYNDCYDED